MFEYQITARGYELDGYNHVNNAVYLNYMEQARWEAIRELELLEKLKHDGKKLVVSKITIRYMREIKLFDELNVITKIKNDPPYLVFFHKIINTNNNLSVARATVNAIMLDDNNKPLDIPEEIIKKIESIRNR